MGIAVVLLVRHLAAAGSAPSTRLPDDRQARTAAAMLASLPDTRRSPPALPAARAADALARQVAPLPPAHALLTRDGVRLSRAPFLQVEGRRRGTFVRLEGSVVGFTQPPLPPWYETMQPSANEYAPLAAGDVNGDGWPDVAVGTASGVELYVNLGGRFAPARIGFPAMRTWTVTDVALIDLDGDGRPDLSFCTWMHGCFTLWNEAGSFSSRASTAFPRDSESAVTAVAFADFDRDGRLDMATGGSTGLEWNFYPQSSAITLWHNQGGRRFTRQPLPAPHGETLSLLATDLTGDGWPDLYAGNDFDEPDVFFVNRHGRLTATTKADAALPHTTMSAMSVDSGDLTNDGRPEIYEDGISYGTTSAEARHAELAPADACRSSYDGPAELRRCLDLAQFQTAVIRSRDVTSVSECRHFSDAARRGDCVAAGYLWNEAFATLPKRATRSVVLSECRRFPARFATMRDVCRQAGRNRIDYGQSMKELTDQPPQLNGTNLLFAPGAHGYTDVTRRWAAGFGGWSWNASFADLDNDSWQDLFVTQGTRLRFAAASNLLYRNQDGRRFTEAAHDLGLEDHVPTGGSLFVDINLDGRLDVVTYPFALTPVVWGNDLRVAPGVSLTLRDDRSSNHSAIGARVTIRARDGRLQMREIKASGGYESQDEPVAHFGLGGWRTVAAVSVRWPDGTTTSLTGLSLGPGRYTVERLAA